MLPAVRTWAVSKISDTVGNYLTVTYGGGAQDTLNGQLYPTEIDYTANDSQGLAAYNSVKFTYTQRPDISPVYQAGTVMLPTQLLAHVKTYAGAGIVSDYRISYNYAGPAVGRNEIAMITLCDSDQTGANCLAPTSFTWQGSRNALTYSSHVNTLAQFRTRSKPNNFIADFNGDGLTDAVVLLGQNENCPSSTGSVFTGSQNGITYSPSNMTVTYNPAYPSGVPADCNGLTSFYTGLTELFDYNGDGITDVLVEDHDNNAENQYYLLNEDSPTHFATVDPGRTLFVNEAGGRAITGDFNGDGLSDIFDQLDPTDLANSYVLQSNGDGTFTRTGPIGNHMHDDDSILFPGDFDGDGCTDLLVQNTNYAAADEIVYECNPAAPSFLLPFGDWINQLNHNITLGDFNGDGKTDILLTAGHRLRRFTFRPVPERKKSTIFSITATEPLSILQATRSCLATLTGTARRISPSCQSLAPWCIPLR